jgi:chaperonin GroEL
VNILKNVSAEIDKENQDIELGYEIVTRAIKAPLRQIVENSGGSPDVIIDKIIDSTSLTTGYNSLNNEIVDDMYKLGIIDAVKVVKAVLQYAVNEAGIFLSIGGDISEEVIETK